MIETYLPKHVAIIPDGNRRWAKRQNMPSLYGHESGYKRIQEALIYGRRAGISCITVWAFSTENWNREEVEVSNLMSLITKGLQRMHTDAKKEKTRVVHIGRRDRLGHTLLTLVEKIEEETKEYVDFTLCIALDYGGKDEIERAERKLLAAEDTSKTIIDFLDTSLQGIPSPDIIIRTGGEYRTSGFLPLQSAYAEWFFEEKLFPDFNEEVFKGILKEYSLRNRRFGK